MPIYKYECQKCGEKFEDFFWPGKGEKLFKCPKCGNDQVKRVISTVNKGDADNSCTTRYDG